MRIFIIEDDPEMVALMHHSLRQQRFYTGISKNCEDIIEKTHQFKPDLIILDPIISASTSSEIYQQLKSDPLTWNIPTLIVTPEGAVNNFCAAGINTDFLIKPFTTHDLIVRVRAIFRRLRDREWTKNTQAYSFGILHVDPSRFQVMVEQSEIQLTSIEFKLLQYLLINKGKVTTRDLLLDRVWGYSETMAVRSVDASIKTLRRKLGKAAGYIETIRGIGYRFCEEVKPVSFV